MRQSYTMKKRSIELRDWGYMNWEQEGNDRRIYYIRYTGMVTQYRKGDRVIYQSIECSSSRKVMKGLARYSEKSSCK